MGSKRKKPRCGLLFPVVAVAAPRCRWLVSSRLCWLGLPTWESLSGRR